MTNLSNIDLSAYTLNERALAALKRNEKSIDRLAEKYQYTTDLTDGVLTIQFSAGEEEPISYYRFYNVG